MCSYWFLSEHFERDDADSEADAGDCYDGEPGVCYACEWGCCDVVAVECSGVVVDLLVACIVEGDDVVCDVSPG